MTEPKRPSRPEPDISAVVQQTVALLGNLAVISALLVYFGWRRTETQAQRLGIDESILGLSAENYILRSVGPVLALLLTVAVAGLAWLWADRLLFRRSGGEHRLLRRVVRLLAVAWIVLPVLVWLAGYVDAWRPTAFVAFPLSIAAGIMLTFYSAHLRRTLLDPYDEVPDVPRHHTLARGFAGVLIGCCLFWSASNYAEVLGDSLARQYAGDVAAGRGVHVIVYSPQRLHITAPGVREEPLTGEGSAYRFRYTGLLLLDHTGETYFLISDGWTRTDGVVVVVDDTDEVRLEFVRGAPATRP